MAFLLPGCTEVSQTLRLEKAQRLYHPAQLSRTTIHTDHFPIAVFERIGEKNAAATIYIEGEPRGSINSHTTRFDPTPLDPVGLKMAVKDKSENLIYLGQPCAYFTVDVMTKCDRELMTTRRFSDDVIEGYSKVLQHYKDIYGVSGFHLVGYSGGGSIAALLANKHPEVLSLRTVAANLNTNIAERISNTESFRGSRNPSEDVFTLGVVPQHHFIGARDEFVRPAILAGYLSEIGPSRCVRTTLVPGVSHRNGWEEIWPSLMNAPLDCKARQVQYELQDVSVRDIDMPFIDGPESDFVPAGSDDMPPGIDSGL